LFIPYFSSFLLSFLFIVYFCMYVFFFFDATILVTKMYIFVNTVVHDSQQRYTPVGY